MEDNNNNWAGMAQGATGGAIGGAIGGLMDMAFGKARDKRQIRNQQALMDYQQKLAKEMGQFNYDMAMKKWEATGYGAQADQMKRAGLNVGLMYGMGGAGGGDSSTVGGSNSPSGAGMQYSDNTGMAMQLGANVRLTEAQAKLAEAQAEKISGVDTDAVGEEARAKKFENDINETYKETVEYAKNWDWNKKIIEGEEANAVWEFKNSNKKILRKMEKKIQEICKALVSNRTRTRRNRKHTYARYYMDGY